MTRIEKYPRNESGFSLTELLIVICGAAVIAGIGIPVLGTLRDGYGIVMAAQQISTELQYARMKAVSSNEPLRVAFDANSNTYHIDTSAGATFAGPFNLPRGITWKTGVGDPITFPGDFVTFNPGGDVPTTGNGSTGQVSIINRAGLIIDITVSPAGQIQTSPTHH
jgi:hypothetical protein